MKLVNPKDLSAAGKTALGVGASIGTLMQIPQVSKAVTALVDAHPHVACLVGALTSLCALLVNPQVQNVLGIKQQVTDATGTTTSEVTITSDPK